MNGGVRVSVIVRVYNGERFLRRTLESALGQTFPHFEIVVVDDGSTDGSCEIVRQFRDPRIRLLRQPNAGAPVALSAGLAAAVGEYVALLDQDDTWDPDSLDHHVRLLDSQPSLDLTFSWFRIVDEHGADMGVRSHRYRGIADFRDLLEDFVVGACSNVVARRSAVFRIGGPDPSLKRFYDLDLCLRIALFRRHNVMAIERELMSYRRHPGQTTRDLSGLREEWPRVVSKVACLAPRDFADVGLHAQSNMQRYFARLAYEAGDYPASLQMLAQGFRLSPAFFVADRRNWLVFAAGLAGLALPDRLRRKLEQLAGFHQ